MMLLLLNFGSAQDLIINGTVNNSGTIRVKRQTTIAQPAVGGLIELTGADQPLPAKQYQFVRLSGSGVKTTTGGNFSVFKNLTIASPVTLNISKGTSITLGDTLFESGVLTGAIQKTVNFSGGATVSEFGKIGATVQWNAPAPVSATVIRVSDSTQFGNGNQSIRRYYGIQVSDATKTGTVTFKYAQSELNGHDPKLLQLWRSTDNGVNWVRHEPVVDTLLMTLTKSNIPVQGLWTAADTLRPIGPLHGAAGIPEFITAASILDTIPIILTTLDSFKVKITDVYGTPIGNVPVFFSIDLMPTPLAGGIVSDTLDSTDVNGIASTVFTLGSKVGKYRVIAISPGLKDTVKLTATAQNGAPQTIAEIPITLQQQKILNPLDSAFTVEVLDIGGNPVDSALVRFSIDSIPSTFAFGQALSDTNVRTDAFGRATTILTLGSKIGTYGVSAHVAGVADSAQFYAEATVGIAATISTNTTTTVRGVVGTTMDPMEVTLLDEGQNPVNNDTVTFRIATFPSNSDTGRLSKVRVLTDPLGRASTILTLGTKVGTYTVAAENVHVGVPSTFIYTADPAAPKSLVDISGNHQINPILTQLPNDFVVVVRDTFGNTVNDTMVVFTIDTVQANGFGARLSVDTATSDQNGLAYTRLTLGSKTGKYSVNATVNGVPVLQLNATATPGAASAMQTISGNNQSASIISPLQNEFVVRIVDIGGNAVPKAQVQFSFDTIPVNASGYGLSNTSIPTDSDGLARTLLTVGNKVGLYRIKATSTGVADTFFTATATHGAASALQTISGHNQSEIIASLLQNEFVVRIVDIGGNDVPDTQVQFSFDSIPANASGQGLSKTITKTNTNGIASTLLTLGNKVGLYRIKATSDGTADTFFTAAATYGAAVAVQNISGSSQSAVIITPLQQQFIARVIDIGGNGVPNKQVSFDFDSIPANAKGHLLSKTTVPTDADGFAKTLLTLGNKVGMYRIKATGLGLTDTIFTATATHGAAAAMMPNAGMNQKDQIFTPLSDPFTVKIVDIGENAVSHANVLFTIVGRPGNDSDAVLNTSEKGTDSLGLASTVLTLGSKVGVYTVKAFVTTAAAVQERAEAIEYGKKPKTSTRSMVAALIETTFTATATHGASAAVMPIFGNSQVNPTETELDTAFVVSVRDRGDNPVPNDTVRFTISSAPANAMLQAVVDPMVLTDSNGIAKTFLRLGTNEGSYIVQATVGTVPAALFVANAYFIYGDINKDIAINIADITSLVDILNKKSSPTSTDSLKADYNHDGIVDTLDIGTIRASILDRSIFTSLVQPSAFLEEVNNAAYIAPPVKVTKGISAIARTVLEATPYGLRVNLFNDEPVRGIEIRLKLKDSAIVMNKVNMLFKRAEMMNVFVSTKAQEVRVVAYNLSNTAIQAETGSIFRLPYITSMDMIDTTEVTIALQSNASAPIATETVTAPSNAYPTTFRLSQNYPNPFNGSTTIEYDIPDGTGFTKMVIQVFNVLGQRVKTLVSEDQQPGRYSVRWDGTDQYGKSVSSGVYFYRLISKSHVGSRKMLYVK